MIKLKSNINIAATILLLMVIGTGCCHLRKSQKNKTSETDKVQIVNPVQDNSDNCALVIIFISRGQGIDREKKNEFVEFVPKLNDEMKINLEIKEVFWGREGEVKYCFPVDQIPEESKKIYIKKLMDFVSGNDRIIVRENVEFKQ